MSVTENVLSLEKKGVSARIYLEPLTGLRGIAAAWVALWHLWGFAGRPQYKWELAGFSLDLTPLIRTGWAGVDIFFVLSGFVLGLAFCQAWLGNRPPVRLGDYFRRRLLRVLPALWLQIMVLGLLLWLSGDKLPPLSDLTAQALLVHNLLGSPATQLKPVYWTLPVEFDFY
ncbi:MAG TPA: acyltransferase, partial [Chromatiaceae bacterium]|nr:acyltransferase [Chromatiaceae bacterium]